MSSALEGGFLTTGPPGPLLSPRFRVGDGQAEAGPTFGNVRGRSSSPVVLLSVVCISTVITWASPPHSSQKTRASPLLWRSVQRGFNAAPWLTFFRLLWSNMAERLKREGYAAGTEEEAVTSKAPRASPTQCHRLLKIRWRHSARVLGRSRKISERGRDLNCRQRWGRDHLRLEEW